MQTPTPKDTTFPTVGTDLDALMDAPTEGKEPFVIDSEEKAEWAVGIIAALDGEMARRAYQHEKRMKQLNADRDRAAGFFGPLLDSWGKVEKERRKRQTVTLATGDLVYTRQAERIIIEDEETARTTAKAVLPDAVTEETETVVKVTFDRKAFLRYAEEQKKATGEIIPGTATAPAGETFKVKTPTWTPPKEEGEGEP